MKKIIIIINLIASMLITGGSTTEYIKLNNINDIMKIERFACSVPPIGLIEPEKQEIKHSVIKEKIAEKPKKEEEVIKTEPVKNEDVSEKTEPDKKTTSTPEPIKEDPTPTPEPEKEEPKQEEQKDNVPNGGGLSFNNLNKAGGVESLSADLQGYATQIMGVVINEEELTHCFKWSELSTNDFEKVKQAINNTYFTYNQDRLVAYYWDQGEYYIQVNSSKERYNKSLEVENYISNAANSCVNSSMTEKEAITAINNYTCNLINYELSQDNALTAFQTGKGNCSAYARVFAMMCRQVGISCDYVCGFGNGGSHAWNKAYIGGVGYWVDPCWNDGGGNAYLLSADLWGDHQVSTINQFFYNDEF